MANGLIRLGGAAMLALVLGGPAWADKFEDDLVGQLHAQGYTDVEVSRTLLGRIRVVATNGTVYREIVVNPRTGEILRDYSELIELDEAETPTLLNSSNSGSNSGSGSSGSNSGSGSSGSSGSGSSGSGSGHSDDSDDDGSGG